MTLLQRSIIACFIVQIIFIMHADNIVLKNPTDKVLYAAIYKVTGKSSDNKNDSVKRITDTYMIPSHGSKEFQRPGKLFCGFKLCDRDIYFSSEESSLAPSITKASLAWFNVGDSAGNEFVIGYLANELFGFSSKDSDTITLFNETEKPLSAAIYYLQGSSNDNKGGDAYRFGDIVTIPPKTSIPFLRPPQKCLQYIASVCSNFKDRDLYVSFAATDLQPIIQKASLASGNIGAIQGKEFYITEKNNSLVVHNFLEKKALPITETLNEASNALLGALLSSVHSAYEEHEHKHLTAQTRMSADLALEEKKYLEKRLPHIKKSLEKVLGIQLTNNELPRIALCGSGGGYRAMIATLGSLIGAEEIGLLDCCTYNAGLSGSTWAIAGWLQSGKTIQEYLNHISTKLSADLISEVSKNSKIQISQVITKRLAFNQKISVIDLYGGLIADKLLKDFEKNPQDILLAQQTQRVESALNIFPIYTAMIDHSDKYDWIECTPYEVGSISAQSFVPSWALGRAFKAGTSQDFAPGVSLGFLMGTWGSALSVNAQEAVNAFKSDVPATFDLLGVKIPAKFIVDELSATLTKVPQITKKRIYPAQVNNWMLGLEGKFKSISQLTLIDAGIDFNLPTPPLLRTIRNVSVIIILDASGKTEDAPELRKAEEYAQKNNLKFPKIDYTKVNAPCSVHKDTDPTVPTVIYMPLMANKTYKNNWDPLKDAFTSTFNFAYTAEQVKTLSGLTAANMVQSKELILEALKDAVEKKKSKKP